MSLVIRVETVGEARCDRCLTQDTVRSAEKVIASDIIAEFAERNWKIARHRKAAVEVVCPECLKLDAEAKRIKRQALAAVAADRRAADEKFKAQRAALLNGSEPKGDNGIAVPQAEA